MLLLIEHTFSKILVTPQDSFCFEQSLSIERQNGLTTIHFDIQLDPFVIQLASCMHCKKTFRKRVNLGHPAPNTALCCGLGTSSLCTRELADTHDVMLRQRGGGVTRIPLRIPRKYCIFSSYGAPLNGKRSVTFYLADACLGHTVPTTAGSREWDWMMQANILQHSV